MTSRLAVIASSTAASEATCAARSNASSDSYSRLERSSNTTSSGLSARRGLPTTRSSRPSRMMVDFPEPLGPATIQKAGNVRRLPQQVAHDERGPCRRDERTPPVLKHPGRGMADQLHVSARGDVRMRPLHRVRTTLPQSPAGFRRQVEHCFPLIESRLKSPPLQASPAPAPRPARSAPSALRTSRTCVPCVGSRAAPR